MGSILPTQKGLTMGEKKGNNGDEKNKKNGGEGIHIRFLKNNKKHVCHFDGVDYVEVDYVPNKLRVIAKVDLGKPRDMVEAKRKKVDGKPQKKADRRNPDKEPPVTTAVIKLDLHCLGCIEKIKKIIKNTNGYHDMSIDNQKNLITVKGTMNMKALADALKEKLKKSVEIVPPKKHGGGNKKEKGGVGEKKEKGGGEWGKGKKDGGGVLPKK